MFLLLAVASAFANISGSIFTSLPDGTAVNQNLYNDQSTVYLNGGPQNLSGSGLPDGIYYFQVTTPDGALLLSNDSASMRLVRVTNGRFAGRVQNNPPTFTLYPIPPPPYPPTGTPLYPHPDGPKNKANGSVPCQLWPFDQTTNRGGEYKVWLIPYGKATVAGDGKHLNFNKSNSKTDDFKLKSYTPPPPPVTTSANLAGHKFYDTNMDGVDVLNNVPEGEVGVQNFTIHIELTDSSNNPVVLSPAPGAPVVIVAPGVYEIPTTSGGNWILPNVPSGTNYKVWEVLPAGNGHWLQTAPGSASDVIPAGWASRGYSGVVGLVDVIDINFGNIQQGRVGGYAFYDKNMDGVFNNTEVGISGVPINITATEPNGTVVTETVTTFSDGSFISSYYPDGTTYTITETMNSPWIRTTPVSGTFAGKIAGATLPQFTDYDVSYAIADTYTSPSQSGPVPNDFGNLLQTHITGETYIDANGNGVLDNGELPLSGVTITIHVTTPSGATFTETLTTGANGLYSSALYPDGSTYTVTETVPSGYALTAPVGGTYSGTINGGSGPFTNVSTLSNLSLNFGNAAAARLSGSKFYDSNANGVQDPGEPNITGLKIIITATLPDSSVVTQILYTGAGGTYTSQLFPVGTTYTVAEVVPANCGWMQTAPKTGTYTGTITSNGASGLVFGNFIKVAGGGLTRVYWANSGQTIMTKLGMSAMLSMLNGSNLRNANGTFATFSTFTAFRTFMIGASTTNMANMLSAQLAAMELNVANGNVCALNMIYAPGTTSANGSGYASVADIIAEARAALGANGNTTAAGAARTYQTALESALENANGNSSLFGVGAPTTIITPSPY